MTHPYQLTDYDYELPSSLIAQHPLQERTSSRLLIAETEHQTYRHGVFTDVLDLVTPKDLLVFNNTRVLPARLFGCKETGGKIECLLERVVSDQRAWVHVKASKAPKSGSRLLFADGAVQAEVLERDGGLFYLVFLSDDHVHEVFYAHGEIPLPPYITRPADKEDESRYQTVYASQVGACAAPTAGLHFDEALLQSLKEKGVAMAEVTLHVGAGTFQPVRCDDIREHVMHQEWIEVSEAVCDAVKACKVRGGRVIAVGTTSVRSLEAASDSGEITPYRGYTNLFLYPGKKARVTDVLLTNFHLPQSSLLMLVSALAGYAFIFSLYSEAIKEQYRFFSYGDAMWLPVA